MRFIRSNILGLIAIFIALGGVAVAVQKNSVKSKHIVRGGVQSSDVRDDTKKKGGLASSDIAADALLGGDIDESTLYNDDSLTGADVDESTLGAVPAAATSANADNAANASNAANADAIDGLDSSALATGPVSIAARNFHSTVVQPLFIDGISVPGLGTLQLRCSEFNPTHWILRFRNDSPMPLDVEIRDGEVAHLPDATSPLPPFGADTQSVNPGAAGPELDLVNSVGSDTLTVWHVVNNHVAANVSPQRYGRFEVLLSGSASNCFASIFAVATR